ncbi:MAG: hypothetical protein J1F60_07070 [Oscillospiraceae bacterium]|nr:hypothetical protein [Oscillospiraceae bacterium]
MANTIEYSKVFQTELDRQMTEGATSGWMEDNAEQAVYTGGKEIKLPTVSLQGLGDYDRDEGYTGGAVTFSYQTFTMEQDRGRRFRLDAMDVSEADFAVTAAKVAEEFQRTKVIPEIDAYRYSTLAAKAEITETYTPDAADVYSRLTQQLSKVCDVTGGEVPLVITMARPVYDLLMNSPELNRCLDAAQFKQGELTTEVKSVNGAVIIPVPSARMKTKYDFAKDGEGGFKPAEDADPINWIICPKTAPVAVSRTDKVKIIAPEQNQFADAWDIDYRKYHDLFLSENAAEVTAVSLNGAKG